MEPIGLDDVGAVHIVPQVHVVELVLNGNSVDVRLAAHNLVDAGVAFHVFGATNVW